MCQLAFSSLYNIRRIRKYLPFEAAKTLVQALVISRIDYCNSILYSLRSIHILKLQRVQNAAARLLTNTPRYAHITPVLIELHWLPVKVRKLKLKLKLKLTTFKALHGLAPAYLSNLLISKHSNYNLRSNSNNTLARPAVKFEDPECWSGRSFDPVTSPAQKSDAQPTEPSSNSPVEDLNLRPP